MLNAAEKPLLDVIRHPDTVLFVGSGPSVDAGLPSWADLLRGLIAWCDRRGRATRLANQALASGDLLHTADILSDLMQPSEIADGMRAMLGFASARPSKLHQCITALGVRRFVTTNYDNLIEQQLGLDAQLAGLRTVTNRQLAELADIQKASANNFIFKPHGCINDAETIVLSRTHYNRILLGENNLVMRVLETIFVTRPILFVGYGLRDPDTLLVLQALQSRYNKSVGEFWAIVPDAAEDEQDYWRRQHGISVVPYATRLDGTIRRHDDLERMLRGFEAELHRTNTAGATLSEKALYQQHQIIRYAARWIRPEPNYIIPVCAYSYVGAKHQSLNGEDLSDIIDRYRGSLIVQGNAGSGKSFAVSRFMSRAAHRILDWSAHDKQGPPALPLLLDGRIFNGDVEKWALSTLPTGFDLQDAAKTHHLKFLVDAIDEMPSDHLEEGKWKSDFDTYLARFPSTEAVYFTRRTGLVDAPELPIFHVSSLTDDVVKAALNEAGVKAADLLLDSLDSPFALILARRYLARNPDIKSAPELISAFIDDCIISLDNTELQEDMLLRLEELAVEVLDSGSEGRLRADVSLRLAEQHVTDTHALDRLVQSGLFVSEVEDRIRFSHRILTEFLASGWLERAWGGGRIPIEEKLRTHKWDDAIVWTSARLTGDDQVRFFTDVMRVDALLGLRIAEHAETNIEATWKAILRELRDVPQEEGWRLDWKLGQVRVPVQAKAYLGELARSPSALAGAATRAFMAQYPIDDLDAWLGSHSYEDFNYWERCGEAIGNRVVPETLILLKEAALVAVAKDWADEEHGPTHALGKVASGLAPPLMRDFLEWSQTQSEGIIDIACEAASSCDNVLIADQFLEAQVRKGHRRATFAVFLKLAYGVRQLAIPIPAADDALFDTLWSQALRTGEEREWAFSLLRVLADRSSDWSHLLRMKVASRPVADEKEALMMLIPSTRVERRASFWQASLRAPAQVSPLLLEAFAAGDDDIVTTEEMLLPALREHPQELLHLLARHRRGEDFARNHIDYWISALLCSQDPVVFHNSVASFAANLGEHGRQRLIEIANTPVDSKERQLVLKSILPSTNLSTRHLTEEAQKALLEAYLQDSGPRHMATPGAIATERYIETVVLPAAAAAGPAQKDLFRRLLSEAGQRHDRRYN